MTIDWNFPVNTNRTIQSKRPNIIFKDKKEYFFTLIDISIPSDEYISGKEFDMIGKYKDVNIEIQMKGQHKGNTIPVVVGDLDMIKMYCQIHLNMIPVESCFKEIKNVC